MSKTTFTVDKEKLEVRLERLFDASPQRLFDAYSQQEQIVKWWGPRRMKTIVDKLDFRPGGSWRIIHIEPNGEQYAFRGEYKEIGEPHKIVDTFEYEPWGGQILVETVTFTEQPNGQTKLTVVSRFENVKDLERMVNSGMEKGSVEGQDRLAELVERE